MPARKARIAHCTWATGIGVGAGRFDSYLNRFLSDDEFELSIISLNPNAKHYDDSLDVITLSEHNRFEQLLTLFRDTDIVQFQGSFDPLVCEAARVSGVPILVEILHNLEPGGIFPAIDVSLCVSRSVLRCQNKTNAKLIYNGVAMNEFTFSPGLHNKDRIVILQTCHRNKPFKNLDEIAEQLLALDPRIELWLAGPQQNVANSRERVRFLGIVEDVIPLYHQADILLQLSKEEPLGLVAIEAMACGCLPIVSETGGLAEIVLDLETGWRVPVGDVAKVLTALEQALELRAKQASIDQQIDDRYTEVQGPTWLGMQKAGRARAESLFSIEDCIKSYEVVYRDLIEKKGLRLDPGPIDIPPTIEALIGEAVVLFQQKKWHRTLQAMQKIVSHPMCIQEQTCAQALQMLALAVSSQKETSIAVRAYHKIIVSGFGTAEDIAEYLELSPPDECSAFIQEAVIGLVDSNPELSLLLVDRMLRNERIDEALQLLRRCLDQANAETSRKTLKNCENNLLKALGR
jgi:glycosyltransferase involved in cell wall biosynthesis